MESLKRRWWTRGVTLAASLVVAAAVLSGIFQLAVLALPGYREQLSEYVSRVAKRPVDIGGVALVWAHLRPQLELADVVLYADDGETPALSAERLRIGFGLMRLLRGDTFPSRIELAGLQMVVEIDADDQLHLRGLDTRGPTQQKHDWSRDVARFDSILLEDCTVTVDDARLVGGTPRFHLVEARARRKLGGALFDASIQLPQFMGESAELEARIDGDLEKFETWSGAYRVTLESLSRLPWLEARLPGHPRLQMQGADFDLQGEFENGAPTRAALRVEATAISAQHEQRRAQLRDLQLAAEARRDGASWVLEVPTLKAIGDAGAWPATRARLQWTPATTAEPGRPAGELRADIEALRLQDFAPWLGLSANPSRARLANFSGEFQSLVARARVGGETPDYSLRAHVDGFGYHPAEGDTRFGGLAFTGLGGELSATDRGGQFAIAGQPAQLQIPKFFERDVDFARVQGDLRWSREAAGWRFTLPGVAFDLAGADAHGQGSAALQLTSDPDTRPQLTVDARFAAADATALKPYLPQTWSPNLRNWLDRGIVAGRVTEGRLTIDGDPAKIPFKEVPGRFDLELDVADGKLLYAPDWPMAEQVAATVGFHNGGMQIVADSGRISGNRVERLTAAIPDFKDAVLSIDGEVDGEAGRYYDFLNESPLAKRLSGLLTRTSASGSASVNLKLAIPLHDAKQTQVDGVAHLKNIELTYNGLDEPFRRVAGDIAFDTHGAHAQQVTGTFYSVPVVASLTPIASGSMRLAADLDYTLDAAGEGLSRYVPAFLRRHLAGAAHWRAEAVLGAGSDGLHVKSDLRGITVSAPPPLGKAPEQAVALDVQIGGNPPGQVAPVPGPGPETAAPPSPAPAVAPLTTILHDETPAPLNIAARYGDRLGAHVVLGHVDGQMKAQRVLVRVGQGEPPLATQDGARVVGSLAELELGAWIDTVRRGNDAPAPAPAPGAAENGGRRDDGLTLQTIDLHADRLHYQGYSIGGVQLGYRSLGRGEWSTTLAGDGAEGKVEWLQQPTPTLTARLQKLRIAPRPRDPGADADAAARPAGEPIDPGRLPVFDFDCEALTAGEARLGHVRLLTERSDGGQRLAQLSATGAELDLKGSGEWTRRAGASAAHVEFEADSRSLGELIQGIGYARSVSAESSHLVGRLEWPLAVGGLDWRLARGRLDLELNKGSLASIEPGAGRVLGLFNFWALPRRLTLDFRDVVNKGLGFDTIKGHFDVADGNAVTPDLGIDSPSLKAELRGRVGLAARDYDQQVTVHPDVSSGVALGALLLGGPVAGAGALVAQEVLEKPLGSITRLRYHVTGSWDNPQVTRE